MLVAEHMADRSVTCLAVGFEMGLSQKDHAHPDKGS